MGWASVYMVLHILSPVLIGNTIHTPPPHHSSNHVTKHGHAWDGVQHTSPSSTTHNRAWLQSCPPWRHPLSSPPHSSTLPPLSSPSHSSILPPLFTPSFINTTPSHSSILPPLFHPLIHQYYPLSSPSHWSILPTLFINTTPSLHPLIHQYYPHSNTIHWLFACTHTQLDLNSDFCLYILLLL